VDYCYERFKSTLRAIVPRGVRMMFLSRIPRGVRFRARYSFYKVRPALYLSGQLKLFHIYPVNTVNSKKEYPKNAARYQSIFAETVKAGKAAAKPPKTKIGSRAFLSFALHFAYMFANYF
jgi:hypothetical protein